MENWGPQNSIFKLEKATLPSRCQQQSIHKGSGCCFGLVAFLLNHLGLFGTGDGFRERQFFRGARVGCGWFPEDSGTVEFPPRRINAATDLQEAEFRWKCEWWTATVNTDETVIACPSLTVCCAARFQVGTPVLVYLFRYLYSLCISSVHCISIFMLYCYRVFPFRPSALWGQWLSF